MHKTALIAVLSVVGWLAPAAASSEKTVSVTGTGIGQHLPQFATQLLDVSASPPRSSAFDSHKTTRMTAYIFVGTHCPATQAYAERLTQLEATYAPKGVDFIFIYPNSDDARDAKIAFQKLKGFKGKLVDDQGAQLARVFGAQRTSEVFVADKRGIMIYHGSIDDSRDPANVKQHYLATAFDETLAGKPVTTASSQVFA